MFVECKLNDGLATQGVLKYSLSIEEAVFLNYFFEDDFVKTLLKYWNNNVTLSSFKTIIAHACFENVEMSKKNIQTLIVLISKSNLKDLPFYIGLLEAIMLSPCSTQHEKWTVFLPYFKELMNKIFIESYIPYNYMADLFIYLSLQSPCLYKLIQEDSEKIYFIRKWLDNNPYPAKESV